MAVRYKLSYFPIRGTAEVARQLFALAGVDYVDERIPYREWPKRKAGMPFHKLPVLEVDGQQLAQSNTINRYLAREFGFAGKTPFEEALVDSLADQFRDYYFDFRPFFQVIMGFKKGDKEETYKNVAIPARDKFFPFVQQWLEKAGSGYLVGDGLKYVDLILSEHVETIREFAPTYIDDYPEVIEHSNLVRSNPRLARWIETRPKTDH